jgi:predicted transcriptional regulator
MKADDDQLVEIRNSEYWKTSVTPGSLLMGFRLKHELTQQELAERSDISQVMISDYETGKRKLTMKAASKFAKALNETPEKFFP